MDKLKASDLKRFLDGECDPEEAHRLMKWIYSDEAKSIIEKDLADFDENSLNQNREVYYRLMAKIQEHESETSDKFKDQTIRFVPGRSKIRNKKLILKIAASVIIILTFSLIFQKTPFYEDSQIVQVNNEAVIKMSESGQKKTVQLSDGTRIKLNSGSEIRFWPSLYDSSRVVELVKGEAFFDVYRDESRPFLVKVNDQMEVQVLGTSFNVNSKSHKGGIVAVKSGKVSVTNLSNGLSVQLNANEYTTVSSYEDLQKGKIDNADLMFGWTDQMLVFSNKEFEQVVEDISLWFGYEIVIERETSGFDNYTGIYENPTLKEVMESLSHAYNLKYDIIKKKIIIR